MTVRSALGVLGELVLTAGVLLLCFLVWLVFVSGPTGEAEATRSVIALQREWIAAPVVPVAPVPFEADTVWVETEPEPPTGEAFAVLRIPRFGSDWRMPVLEGTGTDVLRRGVGHYDGTALPGALGNLALAGHRTTWGRPFQHIEQLRNGDVIEVTTRSGRFVYQVTGHEIVSPQAREVLDPVPGRPGEAPDQARLTLTTCHPEYSARQRWVVQAVLVESGAA